MTISIEIDADQSVQSGISVRKVRAERCKVGMHCFVAALIEKTRVYNHHQLQLTTPFTWLHHLTLFMIL